MERFITILKEKEKKKTMEKITQKEFYETVVENETGLICSCMNQSISINEKIKQWKNGWNDYRKEYAKELNALEKRTCKAHASYLEFSNGSRLYHDISGRKEYYKDGNIVYRIVSKNDDYDNIVKYDYIVYIVF